MEDKVGLTLACLNIKKLVKMMTGKTYNFTQISQYYWIIGELGKNIKKTNIKNDVCLHSERNPGVSLFFISISKDVFSSICLQFYDYQSLKWQSYQTRAKFV